MMTRRTRAAFVVLSVVGGLFLGLAPGCSLDWGVRPDPGDGGLPETSRPDVTVGDTGGDAPGDTGKDSAPDCGALGAAVAAAKSNARNCTFGTAGACKAKVKDQCTCDVVVTTGGSTEAMAYTKAVADFLGAPCPPDPACAACLPLPSPTAWVCAGTNICTP